ncbi:hypothetical protein ABHF54_10005 [Nitrosomonas europaea]|uniref:hypothetical protein n=1 Tax=Nitrosomonas europaea TaxID=915 RepID=UPI0032635FA0
MARHALMRTELLPTFGMPDKKVDGFIARIRERHPKMIFGYPSAMSHIVPCAEQRGVRFDDLGQIDIYGFSTSIIFALLKEV